MTERVSSDLRRLVHERAYDCCEYCRVGQADDFLTQEIDHIIAHKHGGETAAENLCQACFHCNRHKGSDVASVDPESGEVVPLYHPRRHDWHMHFRLVGAEIEPLTANGRATVRLLKLNALERVEERSELLSAGRYPCSQDG
jgi:hypothetical protein